MTIYSLDVLLFLFGTSLLFHVEFFFLFPCWVLTVASWSAYRFLKRQVRWSGILIQNFPQFLLIHTVKGFGIVNKAEIEVFLELSCFFDDPADVGHLISGSSAFFLNLACASGSSWFMYYWSLAWKFLSMTLPACEMNAVVQEFEHSLALLFFGIGMKLTFSSPVATAEFSKFAGILSAAVSQHHLSYLK